MTLNAKQVQTVFRRLADPADAVELAWFFKTGPGEYGEGDRFLGIRVPVIRQCARRYSSLPIRAVRSLLKSPYHEERLLALLILVLQFQSGDDECRRRLFDLYLAHTACINNWDLVDLSAYHIVGGWLDGRGRRLLLRLAASESLWERRIAILATFHTLRRGEFGDSLAVAKRLLADPHDLIHKAVGWMLREVGKRDQGVEESFLKTHYPVMPRTMLRYAIERFPEPLRKAYLAGTI